MQPFYQNAISDLEQGTRRCPNELCCLLAFWYKGLDNLGIPRDLDSKEFRPLQYFVPFAPSVGHMGEPLSLNKVQEAIDARDFNVVVIDVFQFGNESSPSGDDGLAKDSNLLVL